MFDKTVLGISMCYQFNQYIKNTNSKIKSFSSLLNNGGYVQALSGYNSNCNSDITKSAYYKDKKGKKDSFRDSVYKMMDKYNVDVLIYPSLKSKYITLLESPSSYTSSPCSPVAPMTGMPAISVPMGFDSNNLPYGLEIVAKQNGENILYEVAYSYEQSTNNDESPNVLTLYEISDDLIKLKKNYEEGKYNSRMYRKKAYNSYIEIYKEVEEYLKNYNDKESEYSSELLIKYESSLKNLNENKRILYGKEYIYWILVCLIILLVLVPKKKKRFKNKR